MDQKSKIHNIKAHIGVFFMFFLVFIKKVSSRRRVFFRFDGFSNGFDSEGRPFYGVLDQIHVGKSAKISRATSIDVDAVPNECPEDARTW